MKQPNNALYLFLGGALSAPLAVWLAGCVPEGGLRASVGLLGLSAGPFAGLVYGETKWNKYKREKPAEYAANFREVKTELTPEQSMNFKIGTFWLAYSQLSAALGPLGLLTLMVGNTGEPYGPTMLLDQTEKKIFFHNQIANAATIVGGQMQYSTVIDSKGRNLKKITITWEELEDSQDLS